MDFKASYFIWEFYRFEYRNNFYSQFDLDKGGFVDQFSYLLNPTGALRFSVFQLNF